MGSIGVELASYTPPSWAAAINSEGMADISPSFPKGVETASRPKVIWWAWGFDEVGGGEADAEGTDHADL